MRLVKVLLSITFLATLASGLVIPSSDFETRGSDLDIRDGLVEDANNSMLFEQNSSNVTNADIALAQLAEAAKIQTQQGPYAAAANAHKGTTKLPDRNKIFEVPSGSGKPAQTYTGKEVRKTVFDAHMEANRLKTATKTQQKKFKPKTFSNYPHSVPKAKGNIVPIMGMKGKGLEYPLPNKDPNAVPGALGPARVIIQKTKAGHYKFNGVVAHDQTRPAGAPGYNDHFQIMAKNAP